MFSAVVLAGLRTNIYVELNVNSAVTSTTVSILATLNIIFYALKIFRESYNYEITTGGAVS